MPHAKFLYINVVFRTSRFCLKISAIEVSSILRLSFVNMFLNSHFTNSIEDEVLSLSRWRSISYRNQSIDLQSKSMDWFLYDIGLRRGKVKQNADIK